MNVKALLFLLWLNVHHGFSQRCIHRGWIHFQVTYSSYRAQYYDCQSITNLSILHDISFSNGNLTIMINNSDIQDLQYLFTENVRQRIAGLHINSSNVNKIEADAFQGYKNIREIQITFNNVSSLDNNPFNNLNKMYYLDMSHNNIKSVKPQHFTNSPIEVIILSNNKLNEFNLPYAHALHVLNLGNNNIRTLDLTAIYHLPQLTSLALEGNKIAGIPNGYFAKSNNLQYLELSSNLLKSLDPHTLRGLDALLGLSLAHNLISSIASNAFQSTPKLEYLKLGFNLITEFPNCEVLNSLRIINLSHNLISVLQATSLRGLKSLKDLDLSFNRIKRLPADISENTPMLRTLDISTLFKQCIEFGVLKKNFTLKTSEFIENTFPEYCENNLYEGTNVIGIVFAVLGVATLVIVIFCVKKYQKLMCTEVKV